MGAKYTEAQKRAAEKWRKANLEQVAIRVPKGRREEFKAKAEKRGMSLASYICYLIDNDEV